jgi:hypothetical protein
LAGSCARANEPDNARRSNITDTLLIICANIGNLNIIVVKLPDRHHLPLDGSRQGYSYSEEEEKGKILSIRTFPSFSKEG